MKRLLRRILRWLRDDESRWLRDDDYPRWLGDGHD